MIAENNHWQSLLFSFMLYGLLLFAIFKLLPFVLNLVKPKKKTHGFISGLIPIVELGFWLFFLSWYSFLFASGGQLFGYLITGLLAFVIFWLAWYYLRDVIAGIVLQAQRKLNIGDTIHTATIEGRIVRFSLTDIQLVTKDESISYIPYSWLLKTGVFQKIESQSLSSSSSIMLLSKSSTDYQSLEKSIRNYCLALPWVDFTKPLKVHLTNKSPEGMHIEIKLYLFDRKNKGLVEEVLLKEFEK
jgi:small-conductance mechanosensitive channel